MMPRMKPTSFSILLAGAIWVAGPDAAGATASSRPSAAPSKRPEAAQFTLRDGTQIVGNTELKQIDVVTVYGTLTVPISDVVKLRIGKKSDRELKGKIDKCVSDLGSKDFAARDAATVELAKLGKLAYTELRKASFSDDLEVRERANKLLEELGNVEEDGDVPPEEDEVTTPTFTIVGAVKFDTLSINSKFGVLKVAKKDLAVMSQGEPEAVVRTVAVPARATANKMLATGIRVKRGDRLIINASGTVSYRDYGGTQFTPEGSSNYGTWNENFLVGSLLGRVTQTGPMFKVGERYNEKVESDGELYLGVAARDGRSSTDGSGEFKVRIQVQPAKP